MSSKGLGQVSGKGCRIAFTMETDPKDSPALFSKSQGAQKEAMQRAWMPWVGAGALILLGLAVLLHFTGRREPGPRESGATLAAADPYAGNLPMTDLKMSESSNFAGGKVTYIDGQIANTGAKTVTGVMVQIVFHNDLGELSQKETMAINLVRTREPYVDIQPVSAAPILPGEQREFRLILDHVTMDWNQQYPEIRVTQVQSR